MKKIKMLTVIAVATITIVTKAEAQKTPPPPPPTIEMNDIRTQADEFLKNHPAVKDVYFEKKNDVVVELKNGKTEKYNMADSDEKKSFIDKYGNVPKLPPPPPPPPKKEAI